MLTVDAIPARPEFAPMTASFATTLPRRLLPAGLLPNGLRQWAAFHLLCLWTRSDPESVARLLGADGFDAGFGLGDGG